MSAAAERMPAEAHPLQPFLPDGARLLVLGSFPPPRKRWSMDFYYPNYQNDMWRIMGLLFYGDRDRFADTRRKAFRKEEVTAFAAARGLAFYDTAAVVRRLQDNASDKFLEVAEPADIAGLLRRLPQCRAVCVTGQKAADTLCARFGTEQPPVGGSVAFGPMRLYRMPSTSRAYPMPLEKKAECYGRMLRETGILTTNP